MAEVRLEGCRTEPLASYLKALGMLRLVGEQVDRSAAGWWDGDVFVLRSSLDLDGLVEFLVDAYRPTPLLAPWNNGSGFGAEDASNSPKAVAAVAAIEGADHERFDVYRAAISEVRRLADRPGWFELGKEDQVALCRSVLPDEALPWLDATVVLTAESRVFPPLLGTGGNDLRFDFAVNFMQRIVSLTQPKGRGRGASSSADLARAALTGASEIRLDQSAIGQFDPGAAGGPASSPFGSAASVSNPWDFVLLLEGAVVFASAAARRLSGGSGAVGVPFIVSATPAGHPSWAAAENTRGELWAPVWGAPCTFGELQRLIGEGRAETRGRQATNGLEVARALSTLGVDRGVTSFVRHAFVERNGRSTFAVPLGRMKVAERPGAALVGKADGWVNRLRWVKNQPDSLVAALRRLDEAQFAIAGGAGAAGAQRLLVALAQLDALRMRSRELAAAVSGGPQGLRAVDWLAVMDDGTPEFRLAASLASVRERGRSHGHVRQLLAVEANEGRRAPTDLRTAGLCQALGAVVERLSTQASHRDGAGSDCWLGGPEALPVDLASLEAFLVGRVDDRRLAELLLACTLLDWRTRAPRLGRDDVQRWPLDPVAALLLPAFHRRPMVRSSDGSARTARQPSDEADSLKADRVEGRTYVADPSWVRLLRAGRVHEVRQSATRQLRLAGFEPAVPTARVESKLLRPERLLAACLIPLSDSGAAALLNQSVVHDRPSSTEVQVETSSTPSAAAPNPEVTL